MKHRGRAFAAVFAAALTAAPALAADPAAPPVTDWSSSVETVVVTPGSPPMWHVSANGSEVWILGNVDPLPKDLTWNTAPLRAAISGAKAVYLPAVLKAGFFEASWFLLTKLGTLKEPDGQTLDATLPPDLRQRLADTRARLKLDPDEYDDYLPAVAALRLEGKFQDENDLQRNAAADKIADIAGELGVPAKPAATYAAMPVVEDVPKMPAELQRACLAEALDDIDIESAHAKPAAEAWARGDMDGLKANYFEAAIYGCFDRTENFATFREDQIADSFAIVQRALAEPGKVVLAIGLGPLLHKNGLLDRILAAGYTVTSPGR